MFKRFFRRTPTLKPPRSVQSQRLVELRSKLFRHKYKILFIGGTVTYISFPTQIKKLSGYYRDKLHLRVREFLGENQPPSDIFKTFLKESLAGTFKDDQIKKEGVVYLEKLLKEKKVIDQVLVILLKAIKDESFVNEAKVLGKKLTLSLTNDKEVEDSLVKLFSRIFQREEIKGEAVEMVKFVFQQEDTQEELVQLMIRSFGENRVNESLRDCLAAAFYDILMDKETNHRMRIFLYNFLESGKEGGQDSILDLIIERLMKKTEDEGEKNDLDQFFNDLNKRFDQGGKKDLSDILNKDKEKK